MNDSTNKANDEPADDLEQELQSMTPRGLSSMSRQRVERQISESSPRRSVQVAVTVAIAIAASVLLLIGWFAWQPSQNPDNNIVKDPNVRNSDDPKRVIPDDRASEIASTGNESVPTLWTYRRAAENSFDDLDQLLAQHGRASMGGDTPLAFNELGFD